MNKNPLQFNPRLTRRDVLKGLTLGAGSVILGPILGQIAAQAEGKPGRKRIVFVMQSNGLRASFAAPVGHKLKGDAPDGKSVVEISLKDKQLPAALEPLTPFKDRMALLHGLSARIALGDHSCNHGALGCYTGRRVADQTIDSALAEALPAVFPHVLVGLGGTTDEAMNYAHSAIGPNKPLPTVCSPNLAYRSLFGSVDNSGHAQFDCQTHLLDFMSEDVKRASASLPGQERQKLDRYVEAFESLHKRQNEIAAMHAVIKKNAPNLGEKRFTTTSSLILEAQFEIATAALIAGLTNVATITSGAGNQRFGKYPELGATDLHGLGHGGSIPGKTNEESFIILHQLHTRLIAEMATKLAAMPEGNGSMLDNTLIVFLSDSGESHHPRLYTYPMVLIGNLGGSLKTGGRHIEFPGYGQSNHKTIGSFYNTLLHAAGKPREKFGHDDVGLRDIKQGGPITELLA